VSLAAVVLTAAAVVLPPAIYFALSYERTAGALQTEAEINSRLISPIISANPDLWQYEELRLSEYLGRRPEMGAPERRRVLVGRGAVVTERNDAVEKPWLTRSASLFDAGVPVGRIEISRSVRPLLFRSGVLAVAMLAIGALSFRAVRTIPLRAIQRSQAAVRRERDTAQQYLDIAGVSFVILDEEGRVTLVNRKGCEILGRAEEEVLGREWTESFVAPDDRARVVAAREAASGADGVLRLEYAVVRPTGERRLVSCYLTPLLEPDGRRAGVLASGIDVTHEAELEERLRKSEKIEAIGRLAGGVAHDFNNVLAVIRVKAELLRRKMEEDDPRRRHVDDILGATQRAASLTGDLLTFGRRRPLRRERVDVVDLLRRFEQSLRCLVRESIDLRFALPAGELPVEGEALEIERVLMNLVTNAQDAMPSGGRIAVSASRAALDDAGAAAAGLATAGTYAEISVVDTGTGIPPEAQASLFEPFFTTKEPGKGTGLGLSIAYAIMKQHGGAIRFASEQGKGTTFTLLFPLAAPPPGSTG
jgi:PAS domain S-box-containing protein